MTLECYTCKANGFPNVEICFVDKFLSESGKKIPQNLDRTKHQHKTQTNWSDGINIADHKPEVTITKSEDYWKERDLKFVKIRAEDVDFHNQTLQKLDKLIDAVSANTAAKTYDTSKLMELLKKFYGMQEQTKSNSDIMLDSLVDDGESSL